MWDEVEFPIKTVENGKVVEHNLTALMKIYDEPSKYGINNGRISKLSVCDENGALLIHYDRGWDLYPNDTLSKQALVYILNNY